MCRRIKSNEDEDNAACEGGRQAVCGGNGEMRGESLASPSALFSCNWSILHRSTKVG